jgi:ribosome-associated protein
MAHSVSSFEHADDVAEDGRDKAIALARLADEKQAEDIVLLDLRGISTLTDFLVVCSGTSTPHLRAIRKHLADKGPDIAGLERNAIEGNEESQWLILDYWEIMVHVFHPAKREFYALEALWGDAPIIDWLPGDLAGN